MGDLLVKRYEHMLCNGLIRTDKFKNFYIEMLKRCDDSNAEGPASSSGKYHPISSLGPNGLYHHTCTVAILAERMCSCIPDFDADEDHDVIVVSALLHDMCKYAGGDTTTSDHPIAMAKIIRAWNDETNKENPEDYTLFERVAKNIASHMSRWNDIKDYSVKPPKVIGQLPLPESLEEYIICFADMVSAMPNLPEELAKQKDESVQDICRNKYTR